jgi:site-specific recombinase XerD
MLAILLGCGLRRRELAELKVEHLQRREERWAIADLVGKGGHIRTVPIPAWVKETIDQWVTAGGIEHGKLFRCVCRAGLLWGDGISEKVVWHVVKQFGSVMGLPRLAPQICEGRAPGSATTQEESWSKYSSCLATFLCKRQSATLVASSV